MASNGKSHFTGSSLSFKFWSGLGLLAILNLAIFDISLLRAPASLQVQYTPDDAYYYLQLAKNFASLGYWTFDSGISITSGFQLIHAYLLSFIYQLTRPDSQTFVKYGLGLSSLLTLGLSAVVWWKGLRRKDPYSLLFLALILSTPGFLVNSVSIVEWPLVIWFAALYAWVFCQGYKSPKTSAALFLLGLLLSLARSDSGLLAFSFVTASLIVWWKRGGERASLTASAAGLGGSVLGVILVFLHNYMFTVRFIQSSARMKAYWAQFASQGMYGSFSLIASALGIDLKTSAFQRSLFLATLELVSGAVILMILSKRSGETELPWRVFKLRSESSSALTTVLAAGICLGGYFLFYTYSGGLQNWYTANLLVPLFILGVAAGHYLDPRVLPKQHFTMLWFSTAAIMGLAFNLYAVYPISGGRAPWPHQQASLAAGQFLREYPPGGRVGAWNAGVVGYYQGGRVVNLDGLVNEDIYPYVVSNTLPRYLHEKGITYIIDFENMLHPPFSLRGGYNDPLFLKGLEPLQQFDDGRFPEWKFLRLYRINP